MTGPAGLSRNADARPFFAHNSVLILVAPFALEPRVVEKVPFPFHSQPLHQRDRRRVAAIGGSDDAVECERTEGEIYHRSRSLGGETAVLVCGRKGIADFSDSRRRPDNQQRAIAGQHAALPDFRGELKPLAGNPGTMTALLRDELHRFDPRDRFPRLVARDVAIVSIGHETREVRIAKAPQSQARSFQAGEGSWVHKM